MFTVKKISNNWKSFAPQQLIERLESELMRDLPDNRESATSPKEIFNQ